MQIAEFAEILPFFSLAHHQQQKNHEIKPSILAMQALTVPVHITSCQQDVAFITDTCVRKGLISVRSVLQG